VSSAGLPSRGWAGPRAGTFAPRRRSGLARAFAKGGVARSWDWPLIFVTCGLTVLGTVLVWAATEPALRQAGLDPHTYLKKAALWAFLGLILMFVTASIDYRRIRRWTPVLYGLSLLLLLAVLAVGQSVNGAKAWIALPGGFQIEPSEFAKLGLILSGKYSGKLQMAIGYDKFFLWTLACAIPILLMAFAFVAGAGTAITPCVLPVLPALLSASAAGGRRRPLGIVLGLAVTAGRLGERDLVRAQQRVVDPPHHLRHRIGRVQALVGVGLPGQVGVRRHLPARQVNGLEPGPHLLDGLVAGQRPERVHVVLVLQQPPQPLRTQPGQRVLLLH